MLGADFKNNRHKMGKSQEEIARDLGYSVYAVRNWEKSEAPEVVKYYFRCNNVL